MSNIRSLDWYRKTKELPETVSPEPAETYEEKKARMKREREIANADVIRSYGLHSKKRK